MPQEILILKFSKKGEKSLEINAIAVDYGSVPSSKIKLNIQWRSCVQLRGQSLLPLSNFP